MYTKKSIDNLIKKIEYCIKEHVKFFVGEDNSSIIMYPVTIGDYSELRCEDTTEDYSLKRLEYKFA